MSRFNQWQPPTGVLGTVFDYPGRFRRYHEMGYLTAAHHATLQRLLTVAGAVDEPNHGDPLASNILIGSHDEIVLLD
ncbi:hypothetical protein [Nocardia sp. NPDC051570]|uniref:hypothetical protein n=1 Tax=Nocardia sp. NPDC051570 TaxID=3364324 RepID=UPI00379F0331